MLEYWHEECAQPLSQVPAHLLKEIVDGLVATNTNVDLDLVKRLAAIFLAEKT